ncbi:phage tail length tape measure family protein [Roseateles noduli]|uniref:phage tail length tape measure family protein n=1 Tax=Roseateles noduli TaxID=2052484 RepID=UPI003D64EEC3
MADQNTTSLSIAVDSSGVRTAEGDLRGFAKAGGEAAKSASLFERAMSSNAQSTTQAAAAVGKINGASNIFKSAAAGAEKFAASTKLSAYQAQQLSFQLHDLGVQLVGGSNPFTALIQQGSQVAGAFGGIRSAASTLAGAVSGTTAVIGTATSVIAGLGLAYNAGAEQSKAFKNAILQTGNAAGLTEGAFNSLIDRTADVTKTSKDSAREMALAFVQSGQLSGQALEATVTTGLNIAKATGASIEEVQKQLLGVTNGVANFAATQNRSLNFLTSAQYRYIKLLEDQGSTAKAITVTMEALNERYKDQAQNLGLIERAFKSAKKEASDFWDSLKAIGRDLTLEERLKQNTQRIQTLLEGMGKYDPAARKAAAALEQANLALIKQRDAAEANAAAQAESAQKSKVGIEYTDVLARAMSRQALAAKVLSDAKQKLAKSDLSAAEQGKVIAQLQKELDPGVTQTADQSRVAGIKRSLDDIVASYEAAESTLEASRQAGLVSDQDYYAEKIKFVQRYEQARILALKLENEELARQRRNPDNMTADRASIDDRVKDNLAEIGRLQQRAAAEAANLGLQGATAAGNLSKGYADARASAESYLATQDRVRQRELDLMGLGDAARAREAGRNQISDRYDEERRRLEQERNALGISQQGGLRQDQKDQYKALIDLNEEFRKKDLAGWDEYYAKFNEKQRDWTVGVSESFANYADAARNSSKQAEQVFANAARRMEDSIVTFVQTGKFSFTQLASSIIADMIRVEAQRATSSIFSSVLGAFGAYFGNTGMTAAAASSMSGDSLDNFLNLNNNFAGPRGGRAIGGPVSAGGIYRINEQNRPEVANFGGKDYLLTGGQSGTVRPAGDGGGAPVSVTVNIGSGVTRAELQAYVPTIVKQVEAAVGQRQRREATLGRG